MAIEQYQVHVSDDAITALREKIALTKLPDKLQGVEWDMGTPLSDV